MIANRVRLGSSDLLVPRLAIGTETLGGHNWGDYDISEVEKAISHALDNGLNFFDTADCYGLGASEERLGKILGTRRSQAVIASKFGVRIEQSGTTNDNSPAYIRTALEASLRRLNTDYIDLYQLHWPDHRTPLDDVFEALERFVESGKIRCFGVSNLDLADFEDGALPPGLVSFSHEYSLTNRSGEEGFRQVMDRHGLTFLSWGTLAQGMLSGKYSPDTSFSKNDRRSQTHWKNFHGEGLERAICIVEVMKEIVAKTDRITLPQLAIRWVLEALPRAVAITGIKNIGQVNDNLKALAARLSVQDIQQLEDISKKW